MMKSYILFVQTEGIPEEYTLPVLIDLREETTFEDVLEIAIPEDVIEGSTDIRVSAIGRKRFNDSRRITN